MEASNPYAPPTAPVRDIETSTIGEKASRLRRLGASILDGVTASLLVYVPALFFVDFEAVAAAGENVSMGDFLTSGVLLAALPGTLILIGVTWWLVWRNGQTIGKKLLSIKVVRSDGSRASVARIFWVRNVPLWIVGAIPVVGVVTLVDPLLIFRQSHQCLHDQIADTIVIRA